jgi:phage tail-like protein
MDGERSLSLVVQPDQWMRCAHRHTALLDGGGVEITWAQDDGPPGGAPPRCRPGGLAFDRWCRAYRSDPQHGRVDVERWTAEAPPPGRCPGPLRRPLGLAVDRRQRLYVAVAGAGAVHVVDLFGERVLRKVFVHGGHPVDVVAECGRVLVLVRRPNRLLWLDGRRRPRPGPALVRPPCHGRLEPCRVGPGPAVLWRRPGGRQALIARPDGDVLLEVDGATDFDTTADGSIVVAREPGQAFRRFRRYGESWTELEPLTAPGYDGAAVCIAPDGRIAFTATGGTGWTAGSAARHAREGTVVTYRLDAGSYRTRWGRLFLDACIPPDTSVGVRFVTSDEDDVADPIEWTPPDRDSIVVSHADRTPPLPSRLLLDQAPGPRPPFRRPTGREQPWSQIPADDRFETYESPVAAPPGRYLWIELTLTGTERVSPRVRAMRVERPGHRLLSALPRSWSRAEDDAAFLHRLLAPVDGLLHELDERAAQRAVLIDARTTPQEALSWLASFAGLVLDRRWPDEARRTLVAEAYPLFRQRGTKAALARILEIYLGNPVGLVETWQLRGLGGTVLGIAPAGPAAPAVGGTARTAGTLGRFTIGGAQVGTDSYALSAHRFTVLVPGDLDTERRAVVAGIVDVHKPAHTLVDVCELGPGMRVGSRLRLRLTSFVGPGAGWAPAVVGRVRVDGDGVLGRPAVGSRLREDAVVGRVRVG